MRLSDGTEITELTAAAKSREALVACACDRLRAIAHKALYERRLDPRNFVVMCMAVDSKWRELAYHIMPDGHDEWDRQRAMGAMPLLLGIIGNANGFFAEELPDLKASLEEAPPPGSAKLLVVDDSGGTVYQIEPRCGIAAH